MNWSRWWTLMPGDSSQRSFETTKCSLAFLWGASWEHRKRLLRIEGWVLVVAAYVLLIFAYALPADFRNQTPAYVAVAWMAARVRTFMFHGGLLLAVVAAAAAYGRSWRLSLCPRSWAAISTSPKTAPMPER